MKNGWTERPISDFCLTTDYVANGSFAALRENVQYLEGTGYAVLVRLADSTKGWKGNYKYVSESAYRFLKKSSLIPGDLVMSNVGEPGKVFVVPDLGKPMTLGPNAILIRCNGQDSVNRFLYYYFLSSAGRARVDEISEGVAQKKFNKTSFRALKISIPPLPEQQRIVGILDEAFEGISTAKANAEQNLRNARALFESHLQSVFTQRGDDWIETTIGDEVDLLSGFAFKSKQYTTSQKSVRLLRGDNIVQGALRWDDVKRWAESDTADFVRYQLRSGDIVIAMDRPWVKAGLKHAMISDEDLPCLLVQRTARVRTRAKLDNRFLLSRIGASDFTAHVLGKLTGVGVPHISGQQIKDFSFLRPPLDEQRRIANTLDDLRTETRRLESIYKQKLDALDALKRSLLHQAFTGEL